MVCFSLAFGTATKNRDGKIIEAFFPDPILHPSDMLVNSIKKIADYKGGNQVIKISSLQSSQLAEVFDVEGEDLSAKFARKAVMSKKSLVLVILETDKKPKSVAEVFLKLQLISNRLVKPHGIVLDGIWSLLHNIAWTNEGPIDLPELLDRQIEARLEGKVLSVGCVDKFPKMVDYVVPHRVRIADASRVRLGAYVGEGTTVMHEGFINFNAGAIGSNMVEGRISAGVVVNEGSDIGGGASIMGTLSGGGKVVISVGKQSLLGANSGLGFSLGDRCIIESGLYVTASSKVFLFDSLDQEVKIVKASELSGVSDLLFRRNSLTGQIECFTHKSSVRLNSELHDNN
ncbi:2,3,4,5-tetrahydropyridine-2,6-dicarboxylate N-succinyltransferase [Candidatus Photodesmus blepharus]|uniref:2,3,4,5-tetrahydropyridine-2,6-dicarboxylate N-succinyltransferase n=1 Tax=Candidatus Photodesmus blepharonis TaxID=1179155 RepID=A0A084CPD5_9GAMM|nr:2,3,4,5-tetrahydropyridine-2,6-dicarboxylate N-succinyltransferase [Candidatus Photodesmus blepharus]KEY91664.1 2,3,4,5-tetrahydropyridine-2,6-dicarboxylate N-succinyltransferase [Candidatus Photodesmus blepharus]